MQAYMRLRNEITAKFQCCSPGVHLALTCASDAGNHVTNETAVQLSEYGKQ
jgi:hypothetical protein